MGDLDGMGIGQGGLGGYLLGLLGDQAPSQGMGAALLAGAPTGGGNPQPPPANPDATMLKQQHVIYGETAGVYPQLQTHADKVGVYAPRNWDADSADQLKTAREWMAGVSLRNPSVSPGSANLANAVERMVWNNAGDAAQGAQNLQLPAGINHFYIRQDGVGVQGPGSKWTNPKLVKSFGPFINVGGGSTPKGSKTYIDFYHADD